jgi:hypothetical protein
MTFGLFNLLMLAGLAAMSIPVIIHLLNRRRYDVVDWGAMQFLQVSTATRRRLLIEELLLMAVRMGLVGLLVLAMAAPYVSGPVVADLGGRPSRDVVIVIDGSASMGLDDGIHPTPHAAAREWATALLGRLSAGDGVALLLAQQQVVPVVQELTQDLELVRERIARLPVPHGGCDWPGAVREAHRLLAARSRRPAREIIILTDGQRRGWADSESLFQWDRLAAQVRADEKQGQPGDEPVARPRLWVVTVGPARESGEPVPNYALKPLRPTRGLAWVGQRLQLRTALSLTGQQEYQPPYRIRLEADGKHVGDVQPPARAGLHEGQVPLTFTHRFTTPGVHLLSLVLEPDPPESQRPGKAARRDLLPGDNRQDLAVEVVESLPVLLVDGDDVLSPDSSTYFLRKALAHAPDPQRPGAVRALAVPARSFDAALLTRDLDPQRPGSRPRVLVLADVPSLTEPQQQGVERFLKDGGGVLVALGERVQKGARLYNEGLYRAGMGWLPARLDGVAGDASRAEGATTADVKQMHHPALELFRDEPSCTLDRARFPRWWKVSAGDRASASVGCLLTSGDPWLVEHAYGKGKVLLCAVPLDRSWGAGLPAVWEFPVLAHELVYYLADSRSADYNVQPSQPLRYQPATPASPPATILVFPPDGEPRHFAVGRWPFVYEDARATGVYKLQEAGGRAAYFVVQPDPRESDLTPCGAEDRAKVAALLPMHYANDLETVVAVLHGPAQAQELWWLALIGVIALLCGEVWLTRRMVAGRHTAV